MSATVQGTIVTLIGLACAWRVFARFAPGLAWRVQSRSSLMLELPGRPRFLRRLGRLLRPAMSSAGAGCGSGCAACSGCAVKAPLASDAR